MSDLQLSLIVIGVLIVVGVYLFNWLQERRYRKKFEHAFDRGRDDVLLEERKREPVPSERNEPLAGEEPRVEPTLEDTVSAGEIEAEPAESTVIDSPAPPPVAPPPAPPQPVTPPPTPPPPVALRVPEIAPPPASEAPSIEYQVPLSGDAPISRTDVAELVKTLAGVGKPVEIQVQEIDGGPWRGVSENGAEAVQRVRIGLQLADRNGPITEAQLARFRELVEGYAQRLAAEATFPDEGPALAAARDLDAFCADADVAIGINVIAKDGAGLQGTKVRALAEAAGLQLAADGTFHLHDEHGATLLTLGSLDGTPFEAAALKNTRPPGVTFLIDVPRVPEGVNVFRRMVGMARHFAQAVNGTLVDDNRAPLTDAGMDKIARQVEELQRSLKTRGIPPGSALARRLFS